MPVERIENLPAGTRVFLDTNIFVYAFLGHSNQCRDLLGRCATEQILGITSLDVVNEVTHRMMLAEALGKGVIKRDSVRDLRGKWREVAKLTEYWTQTSAIFGLNISCCRQTKLGCVELKVSGRATGSLPMTP